MINYERHILANGLKVLIHQDKSTALATMNIMYDVGARDEAPDKTGFAHLFEHLMFGGSVNIANYDEPVQLAGGENNAFTNNDLTNYYLTLPANNIETAFWLESDRMLNLAFSEKSLDVQRSVVIEEFKQRYLNQPYGDAWLLLRPLCYKEHPYRWATIGKEISHIEQATLADVKSFFKKYYHPANAILCVAGDVDANEILRLCEKWFAPIEAQAKHARSLTPEPVQTEKRLMEVHRDVPVNALYMAWHSCERGHADFYATDLISDILSRGKSSRLYNTLVKEKKLFSSVNAYVLGELDKSLFIIEGKLQDGVACEVAEAAVLNVIAHLMSTALSEHELQKVKNQVIASNAFSDLSISNKALNLCFYELLGNVDLVNKQESFYESVSAQKIQEVAASLFSSKNLSTIFYQKNND